MASEPTPESKPTVSPSSSSPTTPIRFRQIRAAYTPTTITVYQAYNKSIATAAVSSQKLDASPHFSLSRMTWIKPSWAWVLYRSGYSYKDSRQTNILAITLTRDAYLGLLRNAVLTHGQVGKAPMKADSVRVQWDPERSMRMGKLRYRSIQIGIPAVRVPEYLEGIVKIEDVTERARELKRVIDEEEKGKGKRASMEELVERGLVPVEREFEVDEELRGILKMDVEAEMEFGGQGDDQN